MAPVESYGISEGFVQGLKSRFDTDLGETGESVYNDVTGHFANASLMRIRRHDPSQKRHGWLFARSPQANWQIMQRNEGFVISKMPERRPQSDNPLGHVH